MNIEALLAPIDGDDPAGPDLSYDNDRAVIEQALGQPADGEGEAINWREIFRLIETQAAATKDIWLAVYLMRAGARGGELSRVADGAELLAGLLERMWDAVHPKMDEYGFQGRKGPTESLTRIAEFLGPLKRTTLIAHPRLGSYSGEDLERFAINGDAAEGYGMFRAAIAETPVEEIDEAVARLDAIRDAIQRADAVLVAHAGSDTGTNFTPTYDTLKAIRRGLAEYGGVAPAAEDEAGDDGATDASGGAAAGAAGGGFRAGIIESREDVVRALDAVADYYRRKEPGSPIPVVLGRVRGWVTLDFMALLQDIAPDSVFEVKKILTARETDSGY